jgi:uncharacterized protein (UPF0335 family)
MPDASGGVSSERLRSFVKRIEKLEEDKEALAEDLREAYPEAKGTGFDTPTLRRVIRLRRMDLDKRREQDELLELYKSALGMED